MNGRRKLFTSLVALAIGLSLVWPVGAQVTIPNTLVSGAVIRAADLNTNFSTLGNHSLDRLSGGNLSGNITADALVTIDGIDLSVALCSSCAATFGSLTVNGNAFTNWVASVAGGTGITSSVSTGAAAATTIALANTAVTPATYGSATLIPVLTIDQQGRVTGATTATNASGMLLLRRGNGTAFLGGAATVLDSFTVSGLTAFDAIKVIYTFNNPTGAFNASLFNTTDGVQIQNLNSVNATQRTYETTFSVDGTNTKKVSATEYDFAVVAEGTGITSTFVTDWTGTWTLALKSNAGATGSTSWIWRVYKMVGQ